MGYIKKALNKLFINNNESSKEVGKISNLKVCLMLFLLNAVFIAEISGQRHEQIDGYSELKPTNIITKIFNQEHNLEFVNNNKNCTEKYVTTIVENHGSHLTVPKELYNTDCRIKNPTYSTKAIEQFHNLKNKNKFRIKYVATGKYQKIHSVTDFGTEGFTEIVTRFNTFSIRNKCIRAQNKKICGVPNIHDGTYDASFVIDQENQIINILQLEKIQ